MVSTYKTRVYTSAVVAALGAAGLFWWDRGDSTRISAIRAEDFAELAERVAQNYASLGYATNEVPITLWRSMQLLSSTNIAPWGGYDKVTITGPALVAGDYAFAYRVRNGGRPDISEKEIIGGTNYTTIFRYDESRSVVSGRGWFDAYTSTTYHASTLFRITTVRPPVVFDLGPSGGAGRTVDSSQTVQLGGWAMPLSSSLGNRPAIGGSTYLTTLPGDSADSSALHHVRVTSGYPFTVRVGANSAGAFALTDQFGGSTPAIISTGTQQCARATFYNHVARICLTNTLAVYPPYDITAVNVSTNLTAWPTNEPSFLFQLYDAFGSSKVLNPNIRGYLDYATPCYVTRPAPAMRSVISHAASHATNAWYDASLATNSVDYTGFPVPALPYLWSSNAAYRVAVSNLLALYTPGSGNAAPQPMTFSNFNAVADVESLRVTRNLTPVSSWSTNGHYQFWITSSYPYTNFADWVAAGITWTLWTELYGQYTPFNETYYFKSVDQFVCWHERTSNVVVSAVGRAPGNDIDVDLAAHVYAGLPTRLGGTKVFDPALGGVGLSTNVFWAADSATAFNGATWTGGVWVGACTNFPDIAAMASFPEGTNYGWTASAPHVAARWHFTALTNYPGATP